MASARRYYKLPSRAAFVRKWMIARMFFSITLLRARAILFAACGSTGLQVPVVLFCAVFAVLLVAVPTASDPAGAVFVPVPAFVPTVSAALVAVCAQAPAPVPGLIALPGVAFAPVPAHLVVLFDSRSFYYLS
jgi:hypothetical protein